MGFSQQTRADLLKGLFASGGTFYMSLHVSDPGERGNQLTNEVDYDNYERVTYPREDGSWYFNGDRVSNTEMVSFPKAASDAVITHIGLGDSDNGGGSLMVASPLLEPLQISKGTVPVFAAGDLTWALRTRAPTLE